MSEHLPVPFGRRGSIDPDSGAARLLRAFLNGRKAETITAYRQDLEDFQAFIQAPSIEQAASMLLARGPGEANALALDYKAHLMDRELAANTINRLTAIGLYGVVRELGRRLGFKVWPHGLRHAAITEALDLTGGNVRAVQRFSRHRDVRVLERYDDNRRDLGGEVAKQVAASVPGDPSTLE
jgi:site-specific recombinase XerD